MSNATEPAGARRADAWAVLFAMAFPTLITWVYFVSLAEQPAWAQGVASALGKTIQFAFPLVWVLAVQRRPLRWKRPGAAGVVEGIAFGALVLGLMLVTYHAWLGPAGYLTGAAEAISKKVAGFGIRSWTAYAVLAAFYSIPHSFLEEYYWRWFVFGQLRRLIPWKAAAVISSLGFMSHHVIVLAKYFGGPCSLATIVFCLGVAVGGAVWCRLYQKTGSLIGPWLSHLLVDAAIFIVGYSLISAAQAASL